MDISFDIRNCEGDHILVALSYYDNQIIGTLSSDLNLITLAFYDVTLIRKTGTNYVGYKILYAISDILAKFLDENDDAVLCFYCDGLSDVHRSHLEMLPQEYRSNLFSRMFDSYILTHNENRFINHRIEIQDVDNPNNLQIAHFICRKEHESAVVNLGKTIMNDSKP